MALKQPLMILCAAIAVLSITGFVHEFWQWNQTRLYNNGVIKADFVAASEQYKGPKGLFAKAYVEQQTGNFQQARVFYAPLEKLEDAPVLRKDAMFNIANTYMQQAALLDLEKDADQAMPLVELAKTGYRNLLVIDSAHWGAKYNLERALQIVPDIGKVRSEKSAGLQRTVRTVITADSAGNLP